MVIVIIVFIHLATYATLTSFSLLKSSSLLKVKSSSLSSCSLSTSTRRSTGNSVSRMSMKSPSGPRRLALKKTDIRQRTVRLLVQNERLGTWVRFITGSNSSPQHRDHEMWHWMSLVDARMALGVSDSALVCWRG